MAHTRVVRTASTKSDRPRSESSCQAACCAGRATGEKGHLTRWSDLPGVELLKADFKRHAYVPHWHDTYTVALVEAGCERIHLAGKQQHVASGDIVLLNPGDIHDGEAFDPVIGWDFRVFYLSPEVLFGTTHDLYEAGDREIIFHAGLLHHPALWHTLIALHDTMLRSNSLLDRSSNLFSGLSKLMVHATQSTREPRAAGLPVALDRARQFLDANWAEAVSLDTLAKAAGLSRFHLLREFRKHYGLPPHAYQLQLRILKAKEMLFQGAPAQEVALSAGFYDQAHFINVLKRHVGVPPSRIREHLMVQQAKC